MQLLFKTEQLVSVGLADGILAQNRFYLGSLRSIAAYPV
jgi:hypothetical protein